MIASDIFVVLRIIQLILLLNKVKRIENIIKQNQDCTRFDLASKTISLNLVRFLVRVEEYLLVIFDLLFIFHRITINTTRLLVYNMYLILYVNCHRFRLCI